jgi:hypothetical protein
MIYLEKELMDDSVARKVFGKAGAQQQVLASRRYYSGLVNMI